MSARPWILIDGYNLLNASDVFGDVGRTSLEASREALLAWLAGVLGESACQRVTIVFDARQAPAGLPKSYRRMGIRVRFAPRGVEADDLLEELIREHSSPRSLVVVSSDHRLHRAARRRRATPVDSEQWIVSVNRGQSGDAPEAKSQAEMDPDELKAWLEEFGEE